MSRRPLDLAVVLVLTLPAALTASTAIRGTVLRPDGVGMAGARLEVTAVGISFEIESTLLGARLPERSGSTAVTDAEGRFTVDAPGPGVWQVRVSAPGFVTMRFVPLPLANPVELPPVVLRPAVEAPIVVRDAAGNPLAGIGIYAQSTDRHLWQQPVKSVWRPAPRRGFTDAEGRLSLPRARGERLDVRAYRTGETTVARAAGVRQASLTLGPSEPAAGLEVREASGAPIRGAIAAFSDTGWPLGHTAEDGTLALRGGLSEPLRLMLLASGGRIGTVDLRPVPDGAPPSVFTLAPPVTITGRILDPGGAPIAGALVWPGHDPGSSTTSDEEGRYALHAGAGDRVRVQAHAPAFVTRSRSVTLGERSPFTLDLVLAEATALTGRVVDEAGEAIAGARLAATAQGERPPAVRPDPADSRTVTDASGRFLLANLTPETTYALAVARPGFNAATFTVTAASDSADLEIVLRRGRLAFGHVLDLDERPLAGIEVRLRTTPAGTPGDSPSPRPDEDRELAASSDAAGRFELRAPPAGKLDVVARGKGFAPLVVQGIRVPPGESPVDLGTLLLEPGVTIHGQVRDRDGESVAGAGVWILEEGGPLPAPGRDVEEEADALADERGRFVVEGLGRGRRVALYVDAPGYLPAALPDLEPPLSEPVEVVLSPASQVRGEVVNEAGEAVAGAEVNLYRASRRGPEPIVAPRDPERSTRSTQSGEEGRFEIDDVAPGPVELEVWARGFQPSPSRELEIVDAEDVEGLRFVLARGAVLEGRVTDPDLEPVAGARVFLGRPQDRSDSEGSYRVEGIPPGRQYVEVRHPGYNRLVRELEIEPGSNVADFVLEGGHRLSGRVIDASDLPVAGAEVEVEPVDGGAEAYRVSSEEDGGFRVEPAADGAYRLRAHKPGYVEASPGEVVRVAGGAVDDLEIRLQAGARIEGRVLGLELEDFSRLEIRAEAEDRRQRAGEVDFEGRYQILDLGPDDWTVTAFLAGGRREVRTRVAVEPGEATIHRDLEFGRGFSLSGQVLYGGQPLAATLVEVRGHDVPVRRSVTTDMEGLFRLEDLESGQYRLSLVHRREQLIHNEDLALTGDRDVVIEIATSGVAGSVTDRVTGEGVADAAVALRQLLPGDREGSQFTVPTNAEGRFSYSRLTAGRYRLSVQRNGYQPAERLIEVAAGTVIDGLQVTLEPAAGLDVLVELLSGKKPEYITLYGRGANGQIFAETRPAYEGQAPFSTLPPGRWNLLIGATGGAAVERAITVPGEPLVLVLPDAGNVRVRVPALVETDTLATLSVRSRDGRPFQHLAWGGVLRQSWEVVGGRATVEGIPPGLWSFQVRTPDGQTWSGAAATTGGPDVEVSLE